MKLPNFEPSTIPAGEYLAEIVSDPVEKTSQFDTTKTYIELRLALQNPRGEHFEYIWNFTAKTPIYKDLLILLGGKQQISGIVVPPASYRGKFFAVSIIERPAKNDKARLVNEIIRIMPYEQPAPPPAIEEPEIDQADDGVEVPF